MFPSLAGVPESYFPSANDAEGGTEPVCVRETGVRGSRLP